MGKDLCLKSDDFTLKSCGLKDNSSIHISKADYYDISSIDGLTHDD